MGLTSQRLVTLSAWMALLPAMPIQGCLVPSRNSFRAFLLLPVAKLQRRMLLEWLQGSNWQCNLESTAIGCASSASGIGLHACGRGALRIWRVGPIEECFGCGVQGMCRCRQALQGMRLAQEARAGLGRLKREPEWRVSLCKCVACRSSKV